MKADKETESLQKLVLTGLPPHLFSHIPAFYRLPATAAIAFPFLQQLACSTPTQESSETKFLTSQLLQ